MRYEEYTLGFIFDDRWKEVLLIKKNTPLWQAGLYNGIGGHKRAVKQCEVLEAEVKRRISDEAFVEANYIKGVKRHCDISWSPDCSNCFDFKNCGGTF